jgi:hypothetical protein
MKPEIWEALDAAIDDFKLAIDGQSEGRVVIERAEVLAGAAAAALEDHDADELADLHERKARATVLRELAHEQEAEQRQVEGIYVGSVTCSGCHQTLTFERGEAGRAWWDLRLHECSQPDPFEAHVCCSYRCAVTMLNSMKQATGER